VDVAAAQRVAQAQQHAQLPVVPVRGAVAGRARVIQVAAPAGRHEPGWGVGRDGPHPAGVQLRQQVHCFQQRRDGGPTREPEHPEHVRGELPQVPIRGVDQGEVAVIAGQPSVAGAASAARSRSIPISYPWAADPLIGDAGVAQDREDLLGQRKFVLAVFGPLGQLIGQPVPGPDSRAETA
jgi:hypothetical protein